jgi:hypothetical protein
MRGVDLSRYRFDYGLTFAALLMHPDGTVYHRYGGRDHRAADVWLSEASLVSLLDATLAEHEAYSASPDPPDPSPPVRLEDVPAYAAKDNGQCIHCHSVRAALYEDAQAAGTWRRSNLWYDPPPGQIGIDVDRDDQALVVSVEPGSPAADSGVLEGDRLLTVSGRRVLTASDLSFVLHDVDVDGGVLATEVERDGEALRLDVSLEPGWKRATPLEYHWRPFKWELDPRVGFGGRDLDDEAKAELGVPPEELAFRITYMVERGKHKRYALAAKEAGIRKGDVVIAANGRHDFAGNDHFHTWWRFTRRPGDVVAVRLMRDGKPVTATVRVPE